ncbi:Crp/Fnr family transcriptional regulator [Sphingomonas sp.]|uniref:Crp/Fnr family transcriptional regulator n=1 Tax=Sphingomonas sp. TaxID=28214 RepID=UPI0025FDEE4C|nr:Crp/Fnr family transcriptional regulator [Sphingomonas sp.]
MADQEELTLAMYKSTASFELAPETAVPQRCAECTGRAAALCANLAPAALQSFAALGRVRHLEPGATLLWEGEPAEFVGTVRSGMFKLSASLDDGREQILGVAGPGDFVGQPLDQPATHSLTALGPASLCVMPRQQFHNFALAHPAMTQALVVRLFGELERARAWMLLLGRKNAEERVASLLHDLAERSGADAGAPVDLPLSRQQMAGLLGLTIETVSRRLSRLAADGVITLPDLRHFTVEDPAALKALAG